jgi:dimethylsulfoniopropionate demethylase
VSAKLAVSRRIRATPYTPRVEALGVSDYSVVNHTILPKGFGRSTADDYWHLREHVQLWDVSCQRQVQLRGPDAARLAQLMTPRDLRHAKTGQCLYVPIIDNNAGMINDPVLLKLADDHFWLSIADSDVALWAGGIAQGMGLNVIVDEPPVAPLAIQGPKADDLMASVFGEAIRTLGFFKFRHLDFNGEPLLIARSGYSKQGGFEIYLHQPNLALSLWDTLWEAGQPYNIAPGSPNLIERVEGGLLSYGNEFTRANNPLECGLGQYCNAGDDVDHIGRKALQKVTSEGPAQQIRGILFDGDPCPPCASTWPLRVDDDEAGFITTAIWSPRFRQNVALGMLRKRFWKAGQKVSVHSADGQIRRGTVITLPFTD